MSDVGMTVVTCGSYYVAIWLHTAEDPAAASWKAGQDRVAELKRELGGDTSKILTLAVSDGGAPNSVQRKEYNGILENKARTVGVTGQLSNRLIRGVATALNWVNPNFRVFPPDQFDIALEYLGISEHCETVLAELRKLQESMPPVQALASVLATRT